MEGGSEGRKRRKELKEGSHRRKERIAERKELKEGKD
jgi:hypothetical protein